MKERSVVPPLPVRRSEAHKGDFGHVLVLAGSARMTGAALLTSMAAGRAGAGLVTLGLPARIHPLVAPALLETMSLPLPSTPSGAFSRDAVQPALDFATNVDAIALGPGITTEDETVAFATRIGQRVRVPVVLDADGLNCLAKVSASQRRSAAPRVLTPHPGEAARLLDRTTAKIQKDRRMSAEALARRYSSVVVLKGHGSVVTDGDRLYVNRTGNPGMATGGSGDVLTGIIAALLAQDMTAFDAAVLGVWLHGTAGDLAAREVGQHSLLARDLLAKIGDAFLSAGAPAEPAGTDPQV
jgi:NAD(P)H-hydrate epimerase